MNLSDLSPSYFFRMGFQLEKEIAKLAFDPFKRKENDTLLKILKRIKLFESDLDNKTVKYVDMTIEKLEDIDKDEKLSKSDIEELVTFLRTIQDNLDSILRDVNYIKPKQDLTLNPEKLNQGAEEFFSDDIWSELPEMSKNDLDEAARCIICDIPNAASVMAMRATEMLVRRYYEVKTGEDGMGDNWGHYINRLREKDDLGNRKYDIDEDLVNHLEYLKRKHRDLASHPEKNFTIDEAQNVFNRSVATIKEISEEMKKKGELGEFKEELDEKIREEIEEEMNESEEKSETD